VTVRPLSSGGVTIPVEHLASVCRGVPERLAWLEQLPGLVRELQGRWSLSLEPPWTREEVSCAWVAPALRTDGTSAVLKLAMPHMEGAHEIEGLRFWDGDPTVRLLEADTDLHAMLVERCEPGMTLRHLPEAEQDGIVAGLLRRLWRLPAPGLPFRPLSAMLAHWAEETNEACPQWTDAGLVRAGLRLFDELGRASADDVVLATDLHAGNVLRAQREPWLVIDPKPFVGDRAYDATQHLFNCEERLSTAPHDTLRRVADRLEIDEERLRMWMFARAAAEPRERWNDSRQAFARALA